MNNYIELICIETDITNFLIVGKKYYGFHISSYIKYIEIYDTNYNYIAPFRKNKFKTIDNYRNERINNLLY